MAEDLDIDLTYTLKVILRVLRVVNCRYKSKDWVRRQGTEYVVRVIKGQPGL